MVKIDFYLIDLDESVGKLGNSIIKLFGRTVDGKRICVLDNSFKPFFWVLIKNSKDIKKVKEKIEKKKEVIKTEIGNKFYFGKESKAIKVFVNNRTDLLKITSEIKKFSEVDDCKEIDISTVRRYLIEKELIPLGLCSAEGDIIHNNFNVDYCLETDNIILKEGDIFNKPKILAFDIEVYSSHGRHPIEGTDPIIMVSFIGNDNYKKLITWKKFSGAKEYIEFVKNEAELIQRFKKVIDEYCPDYLVGYFSDGFDLPYLKVRAEYYGIRLDIGLDNSKIKFSKRMDVTSSKIVGIAHLDIFKFIINIMGSGLLTDSYDLSSVANELLGEKKIEINIEDMFKAWEEGKDIEKFCEYNMHDSKLTLKICESFLPNLEEMVKLIGQSIFDVCRMSYGQLVEWYLIKKAHEFNEICPNRPSHEEIKKRRQYTYKGAFVFEPNPGLYENIAILDYKSLYPSIIVAKNISIETLTKNKTEAYETPKIDGKKYYFSYKKEGFIPIIVKDLIIRRNRIKEILKKEKSKVLEARSYALKTVANSSYGYFGFFGARWYSIEAAASITAFGREYIQKTIEEAKKNGFNVIYADTDSIAIVMEKHTKKDVLEFMEQINRELPSLMELELEDFYVRGIFVMKKGDIKGAKKKYALINEKDEMKIIGFETIRRDWSFLVKEVQSKVLEMILKENNVKKALNYTEDIINKIRKKEIPIKKMIIQTQLRKDLEEYEQIGPHVAVARRMKKEGLKVGAGSIIKFVITEGRGMIRDRARLPEECESYDSKYYINNQIIPAVERIFDALGYSKKILLEEKEQSKLGDF